MIRTERMSQKPFAIGLVNYMIPAIIFCAQPRRNVRPIKKLILAATVAQESTISVPGINPNRYPLEAVNATTGIANISARI